MSFPVKMSRLASATVCKILKLLASIVSKILKKNHFLTAEAAAKAEIDDSIKRKRNRVSPRNRAINWPADKPFLAV